MDSSPYYQSTTFNKAKGTINDLPNCVAFCMCRIFESLCVDKPFSMFTGRTAGGYPHAKEWYTKTTFATGSELRTGSIAVFDGNYGHVAYVERKIDDNHAVISQSQYDDDKSLRNYKYFETREVELTVGKATLSGIGRLLGFIYLPIDDIRVKSNPEQNQILVKEEMVNVRIKPDGDLFRSGNYIPMGYYNVLQKKTVDGYDWYEVEQDHWVREGEWIKYIPKETTNKELEKENAELKEQLAVANSQLEQIRQIVC